MKRQILSVATVTLLVQFAGFGKSVLVAYYFGVGSVLDGYYLAQAIPAALSGILAGFFQSALLPSYAGALQRDDIEQANALLGRSLVLAAVVGVVASTAIVATASPLIAVLTGAAAGSPSASAAVDALRWLAFLLVLNALVDCTALALTAHGKFTLAAGAPAANAALSAAILVAAPQLGLLNLVFGTLAGVAAQLLIVGFGLAVSGARPSMSHAPTQREALRAGIAILPGLAFANLSVLVPSLFAARLGEGAVAALGIAARLHGAASMVLATAVSTVLLPQFARMASAGQHQEIIERLKQGFVPAASIGLIVVLWIAIAGPAAVAVMFERGAFQSQDTNLVAFAWLWLSVGLFSSIWSISLAKALQAARRSNTISAISFLCLVGSIGCGAAGAHFGSIAIVAFAASVSAALAALLCAASLRAAGPYRQPARENGLSGGTIVFLCNSMIAVGAWWFGQLRISIPVMGFVSLGFAATTVLVLYKTSRSAP